VIFLVEMKYEGLEAFCDGASERWNPLIGRELSAWQQASARTRAPSRSHAGRRPAIIIQPRNADDVAHAIRFARNNDLQIAIKGGGHNVAGNAACDGGLMLDFPRMNAVEVDPARRTARVEPGALISDLDRETQTHGLATPGGFISSTGVAGLTLGGGFGYLSRKRGLSVDNLRAAELTSVDGRAMRASEDVNPDLFWGLRGGGGNFGIVTSFEFDPHDLGPEVLAGPSASWNSTASSGVEPTSTGASIRSKSTSS
jgi:FAD/FMN-containing dehydrogenase